MCHPVVSRGKANRYQRPPGLGPRSERTAEERADDCLSRRRQYDAENARKVAAAGGSIDFKTQVYVRGQVLPRNSRIGGGLPAEFAFNPPMTDEEGRKLCLSCGEPGHRKEFCPSRPSVCLYCEDQGAQAYDAHELKVCLRLQYACTRCMCRGHFRGDDNPRPGEDACPGIVEALDFRNIWESWADYGVNTRRRWDNPNFGYYFSNRLILVPWSQLLDMSPVAGWQFVNPHRNFEAERAYVLHHPEKFRH